MPFVASLAGSEALLQAVAGHTLTRLRACARRLAAAGPEAAADAALVASAARSLAATGHAGERILFSADLRAVVTSLETAHRIQTAAASASRSRRGGRRERLVAAVFAEVAATPFLRQAAPQQIPGSGFLARAAALARRLELAARAELPLLLATHCVRPGTHRFRIVTTAEPERGLGPGEVTIGGSGIVLRLPEPGLITLVVERGRAEVHTGSGRILPVTLASSPAAAPASAWLGERPRVPGSPSLRLGHRLLSRPDTLEVGAEVSGLAPRLGLGLALIARVWPEAWSEIHLFTELVIPLDEPGTVSYSLAARPGVSYINTWSKTRLQLADDLLHETAHHKLHAIEELEPLVRDDGDPLWWSPWRRAFRPLRGILHAAFTFTYGALLFARLARARRGLLRPAERRFAARRLLEEEAALDFAARDLSRARRQGRLAAAGDELRRELSQRLSLELRPAAAAAERWLAAQGRAGSRILGGIARHHRTLERMRGRGPEA